MPKTAPIPSMDATEKTREVIFAPAETKLSQK
jgi:hypothetical protein